MSYLSFLAAGDDADELDAVAFGQRPLGPFVAMHGEAVMLY